MFLLLLFCLLVVYLVLFLINYFVGNVAGVRSRYCGTGK